MKSKTESRTISESIGDFSNFITTAGSNYQRAVEDLSRYDDMTQDYLHQLELENLNYRERAKVATQIAKCRKKRRTAKDIATVLAPIVEFLEDDKNKSAMNRLKDVLGKTRKAEERLANRKYTYRMIGSSGGDKK